MADRVCVVVWAGAMGVFFLLAAIFPGFGNAGNIEKGPVGRAVCAVVAAACLAFALAAALGALQ